jgi:hypothetical protein
MNIEEQQVSVRRQPQQRRAPQRAFQQIKFIGSMPGRDFARSLLTLRVIGEINLP